MKRAVVVLSCLLVLIGLATIPASADEPVGLQIEQTPRVFYPLVRDGYMDSTTTAATTSLAAQLSIEVSTADGTTIWSRGPVSVGYYDPGWANDGGDAEWTWNGRDDNGRIVPIGTYTIRVVAEPDDGTSTAIATTTVRVATGTRWVKGRNKVRGGSFYSSKATGRCKVSSRTAHVTCRGRGYAQLNWRIRISKGATIRKLTGEAWGHWAPQTRTGDTYLWFDRNKKYLFAHIRVTKWQYATVTSVVYKYEYATKI